MDEDGTPNVETLREIADYFDKKYLEAKRRESYDSYELSTIAQGLRMEALKLED